MDDKKIKAMEHILSMLNNLDLIKFRYDEIDEDIRKNFNSCFENNTVEQAISNLKDTLKKHLEFCVKE